MKEIFSEKQKRCISSKTLVERSKRAGVRWMVLGGWKSMGPATILSMEFGTGGDGNAVLAIGPKVWKGFGTGPGTCHVCCLAVSSNHRPLGEGLLTSLIGFADKTTFHCTFNSFCPWTGGKHICPVRGVMCYLY